MSKKKNIQTRQRDLKKRGVLFTRPVLFSLALAAITFIVYAGTLGNGFSSYDDPAMIVNNADIQHISFSSLKAFFTNSYLMHYHPLTTLSLAVDRALFGPEPWGFHFTNLLLHVLNVLLLFSLLRPFIRIDAAAALALLWAVHPVNTEAVAWATARKDVLFAAFYLASLTYYLRYTSGQRAKKYFYIASVFFLCALLSKAAAVSLPFVFLLLDYHAGRKINVAGVLEKIPHIALSAGAGILSLMTQKETVDTAVALSYSFIDRVVLFFYALGFYVVKFAAPFSLSVIHLFPAKTGNTFEADIWLYAAAGLAAVLTLILLFLKKRSVFWFVASAFLALLPVLQVVPFAQSIVAERFAYIPYALLFIAAAIALREYFSGGTLFRPLPVFAPALFIAIVFAVLAAQRVTVWKTGFSLYEDALKKNPESATVLTMCGVAKLETNEFVRAKEYFEKAVEASPRDALALFSLGTAHLHLQNYGDGVYWLSRVLALNEKYEDARYNRMLCYNALGKADSAMLDADKLISLYPEKGEYYYARALLKNSLRDSLGSAADLEKARRLGWGE